MNNQTLEEKRVALGARIERKQAFIDRQLNRLAAMRVIYAHLEGKEAEAKPKQVKTRCKWRVEIFGDGWKVVGTTRSFMVSVLPVRSFWTSVYRRWDVKHERKPYGTIEASLDGGSYKDPAEWVYTSSLPVEYPGEVNEFLRQVAAQVKNQVEGRQ